MSYYYDEKEISTRIFNFIYGCSMRDAILQQAFKGEKRWVGKVGAAKPFLREYIDLVIHNKFSSQKEHDDKFIEVVDKICKEINNSNSRPQNADVFSFGNAQKLINIAVKHVYSVCYYNPHLREGFRFCHCPLDSIMIGNVWRLYKEELGDNKRKQDLVSSEFFCKAWGSEGQTGNVQPVICDYPDRYLKFQTAIKELIGDGNVYAIEFDYLKFDD